MKNIRIFYMKIFILLVVKFSVYLNRHVFFVFFVINGLNKSFSLPVGVSKIQSTA